MSKQYESGQTLQQKIARGIDVLADNVAATMGPRGRNVILHQEGSNPIITKDGVTVAKFVDLEDPFENVGVQILKQVADQTNTDAGDGTTTSTVLARAIYNNAQKYIASGVCPVEIKRGMDKAVAQVVSILKEDSKPVKSKEDIKHVATISANGDKVIGDLIATAIDQAGKDGAITVEEARSLETSLDIVEGFRFDSGYISPQFINNERRHAVEYENPYILVTDAKLETVEDMLPVLELVAREGKPFVIVAENIEGQALAALIMNAVRGTMRVAAVKAPRYGEERREILKDLAVSTGATFVTTELGHEMGDVKLTDFGTAKKINITKNITTIVDGQGEGQQVQERIETLKETIKETESLQECEKYQERITRLASGIAIIRVGAATEIEMVEKKHRLEDALEAVRSAREEGLVSGGGVALLRVANKLDVECENDEQECGVKIIKSVLTAPIKQMLINAGQSPDVIISEVTNLEDEDMGYNVATGEYVNMYETGIIDPVKVTSSALKNASSVVSTLITTNHCIIQGS
jgi:chaperonin GroEL